MKPGEIIRLPIRATYTVSRATGQITDRRFDYADLPAAAVAEFFLSGLGSMRNRLNPLQLQDNVVHEAQ